MMVSLPEPTDPTLDAVDAALVARRETRFSRRLGASSIGRECERSLWLEFRWAKVPEFDAMSIKRFEDGDRGEAIMAERLRMLNPEPVDRAAVHDNSHGTYFPGPCLECVEAGWIDKDGTPLPTEPVIELCTEDPRTGRQFEFEEIEGHFVFRPDGAILGLLQAPKRWHLWENKVSEKGPRELSKLKQTIGEKAALKAWSRVYYAQAVIGMWLMGLERCYHTVSSPGMRHTVSCRTEEDDEEAMQLLAKARRIVEAKRAPPKIGEETHYVCRLCSFRGLCHGDEFGVVHCRSCLHSTPIEKGQWHCQRFGKLLTLETQKEGCPSHKFIPDLVPGEQIDIDEAKEKIYYKLRNGKKWVDE